MEKMFEDIIQELKSKVEEYKKVTNKRLEEANELIEEITEVIKDAGLNGWDDIEMFDYKDLGLRYRGADNLGWWVYLVDTRTYNAIPHNTKVMSGIEYLGGNFNAKVTYMNAEDTLAALRQIPDWIEHVRNKIIEIKEQYESVDLQKSTRTKTKKKAKNSPKI